MEIGPPPGFLSELASLFNVCALLGEARAEDEAGGALSEPVGSSAARSWAAA